MSHSRRRPIVGQTPVNTVAAKYIIVEMTERPTTIQCIANGTVTFTVATTIQNIMYDAAAQGAWNVQQGVDTDRYVAPTAAAWDEVAATGSVDTLTDIDTPVFAFRINQTAGTGSVTYTILQA